MRPSHRISLIDAISKEMDARYSYQETDLYLNAWNVSTHQNAEKFINKTSYIKATIGREPDEIISNIADDLEIDGTTIFSRGGEPPKNWPDQSRFRLFISHLSEDKQVATRLQDCLRLHQISAFVAHEDILPTQAWEREIERALRTMDAFLAIHTKGFANSTWTQQEVGFAYASGVKIISFRMGEDPTGFIGKNQALPRLKKRAEDVAEEIKQLLSDDPLTASRMDEVQPAVNFIEFDDEIPF